MRRGLIVAIVWGAALSTTQGADAADKLDATLQTCQSCHGAQGLPNDPTVPIIWGQEAKYIEKQLQDYRSGDRDSQIMSSMAESLKPDDAARAAATISQKAWPKREAASVAAPDGIAACQGCHGGALMGGDTPEGAAPRLAGQFAEYLAQEMDAFARGERANQPTMSAMMQALSADQRTALATYLASLDRR